VTMWKRPQPALRVLVLDWPRSRAERSEFPVAVEERASPSEPVRALVPGTVLAYSQAGIARAEPAATVQWALRRRKTFRPMMCLQEMSCLQVTSCLRPGPMQLARSLAPA
jgi:hypothetical protein